MNCIYEGNMVEIYKVAPHIYFRKADLKTRKQCNSIYIEGENSVSLVDPSTWEAAEEICDEVHQLFHKPLRNIFLTHGHRDHAQGAAAVLSSQTTLFCSHKLVETLSSTEKGAVIVGIEKYAVVNAGGIEIELRVLGDTAHSPWDMLIGIPKEGLLCTGDLVAEYPALFFHYSTPEQWITHLRKIARMNYDWILPGHGWVMPVSQADETADYLAMLFHVAEKCIECYSPAEMERKDLSYKELTDMVNTYLSLHTSEGKIIQEKAGEDAVRQIRMMIRLLRFRTVF